MKVFVFLVFAVFTGCDAIPSAVRPRSKLEVLTSLVSDLVMENAKAADRIYRDFRRTEFGNAVVTSLRQASIAAGDIVDAVMQNLSPATRALMRRSTEASFKLAEDVSHYMVENHLEPMAERAAPVMEEALGQLVLRSELVQDLVSPYITELMEKVDPYLQNIQARIHALNKSFVSTK